MKLHTGLSPNGMRVTAFLAEKGVDIDIVQVDIQGGQTRGDAFRRINSLGEVPVLELDDGTYLTESLAICRYLEARHPTPSLMGASALEVAKIDMWTRRIEHHIMGPIGNVARHTFQLFADTVEQMRDYAETQRRLLERNWAWLDDELSDGRRYVCDNQLSVADITGMAALLICHFAKAPVPDRYTHVNRWADALRARPGWPVNSA